MLFEFKNYFCFLSFFLCRKLDEYSADEVRDFPKLWDYPEEYVVK